MKKIEVTGKTVNEALQNALIELNTTKDKVEIEVIEEGSKGFLNFIGVKPAKLVVTFKRDYLKEGEAFIKSVLASMNISANVKVSESKDIINIDITGPKMGLIIGHRGETLDSLQYLVSLVINKGNDVPYKRVVLDAENYRSKREETLKRVADKTAYKVRKFKKAVKLEPMNPYERRIIHSVLQDNEYVRTFSEGEVPYRRVVVELKK